MVFLLLQASVFYTYQRRFKDAMELRDVIKCAKTIGTNIKIMSPIMLTCLFPWFNLFSHYFIFFLDRSQYKVSLLFFPDNNNMQGKWSSSTLYVNTWTRWIWPKTRKSTIHGRCTGLDKQKKKLNVKLYIFSYPLILTYVLCAQNTSHPDGSFEYPQHMIW